MFKMAEMNISSTAISSHEGSLTNYEIPSAVTDGASDLNETEYINTKWRTQFGIYKNNRSVRSIIDGLARWTIGKGYKTNPLTELLLLTIKGNGRDTFNSILKNLKKTMEISGDAFAEIIRNKESFLINLKPLDPGTIAIVANKKGMITKYRQYEKTGEKKLLKEYKTEEIFHL